MKSHLLIASLTGFAVAAPASAIVVPVGADANTRVVTGTTNSRDDNNGGADSSLIGINAGGIDNFVVWGFPAAGLFSGDVQGDATLTVNVAPNFTNANHGTTADTIWIRELFATNAGWLEGGQAITAIDNESDMGWASFLNRIQYNDDPGPASGTTQPWMDAGGNGVANLLGAVGPNLATTPGYDDSALTASISFTIPEATMQGWIDNGLAGIVLGNDDDGDSKSRFNFTSMVIEYEVPDTLGGDTDLDGDVDDSDLGTAFASYTGPLDPA